MLLVSEDRRSRSCCVLTSIFQERIHALEVRVVKGVQHAHAEFKIGVLAHFDPLDHGEVGGIGDRILDRLRAALPNGVPNTVCAALGSVDDVTDLAVGYRNDRAGDRI